MAPKSVGSRQTSPVRDNGCYDNLNRNSRRETDTRPTLPTEVPPQSYVHVMKRFRTTTTLAIAAFAFTFAGLAPADSDARNQNPLACVKAERFQKQLRFGLVIKKQERRILFRKLDAKYETTRGRESCAGNLAKSTTQSSSFSAL